MGRIKDLRGRKVFVTGAASGIGKAVAEQAAREGAVLHLTDVQAGPLAAVAEDGEVVGRFAAAAHGV